jgi:hypothetical protein
MGWYGLDWSGSGKRAVGTVVNAVMNIRVPQNAGNFLSGWASVSISRRTRFHGVLHKFPVGENHKHAQPFQWVLSCHLVCARLVGLHRLQFHSAHMCSVRGGSYTYISEQYMYSGYSSAIFVKKWWQLSHRRRCLLCVNWKVKDVSTSACSVEPLNYWPMFICLWEAGTWCSRYTRKWNPKILFAKVKAC